jgi:hypothetical protein
MESWSAEKAVDGGFVKLVGRLEFRRVNDVVIVESVSILVEVSLG